MNVKLTKAVIERAPPDPSGKQTVMWDTEVKGFGVVISPKTKTYIAQRRIGSGSTATLRRVTIGRVGPGFSLDEARTKAGATLQRMREGIDPKAERRRAAVKDQTLQHWFDKYLEAQDDLRPRSVEEYRRSIKRLDDWLNEPLRDISDDLAEIKHKDIGKKTGKAAANSAMRTLRAVWNYAQKRDRSLPANPTELVNWFKMPPRTRNVSIDNLPAFYKAVEELPNRVAADYIKLLLFTGLRRREAAALHWDEVKLESLIISLPASRTKADRKLDLPMSSFVHDMLVARRALGNDGGWVFGASSASGHIEEPKFAFDLIAKATGIEVSPHDLRRTFATIAESTDISPLALKALLNHALPSGDVTSGYIQMTAERLRDPVQKVCDRLKELCAIPPLPEGIAQLSG